MHGPVPADVFAVLADPTRRRLVEVPYGGERSVGDLVAAVDIAQPGVSRHLRLLSEAGFVNVRADGQRRLYSLRPEPLRQLETWMRRYGARSARTLRAPSRCIPAERRARHLADLPGQLVEHQQPCRHPVARSPPALTERRRVERFYPGPVTVRNNQRITWG
jgi:DNA-binding transcriptional ArsR family regulator